MLGNVLVISDNADMCQVEEQWTDKDQVMFHAMFQLLLNFFDEEDASDGYDDPGSVYYYQFKQLVALRDWYIRRRDDTSDLLPEIFKMRDTSKMLKLVRLRHLMWT